jgi:DNA repair protein RecO
MQQAAEGIILASTPYEESFILDVFTKEYGRVKFVAKGQKKHKPFALSPLLSVELTLIPSEKPFWKCSEIQVCSSFPKIRTTRASLMQGAYIAHLLTKVLPTKAPHPECFDTFCSFLEHLPLFIQAEAASCVFLAKFCYFEGLFPGNELVAAQKELSCTCIEAPFELLTKVRTDQELLRKLEKLAKGGT